jgi:hypothetical protein
MKPTKHALRALICSSLALWGVSIAYAAPVPSITPSPIPDTGKSYGWRLIAETKDGIRAYKRNVPGSKLLAFKGEGVLDVPLAKAFQVLFDTTRATEWIADLKECRVVREISDTEYIEYDRVGTPPLIMKNRDFVSRVTMFAHPKRKTLVMHYEPATDPSVPAGSGNVRGEIAWGEYNLISIDHGRRTQMTAEILCDPKGGVPQWLVNWFQQSWPLDTFRKMRRQAAKPDIPDWPLYDKLMKISK